MKFLDELQGRIAAVVVGNVFSDAPAVGSEEKVVGRLSGDLLQLYALRGQLSEGLDSRVREHIIGHLRSEASEESCGKFREDVCGDERERLLLGDIFWAAVHAEFDLSGKNVGIRAEGDVVTWEDKEEEDEAPRDFGSLIALIDALIRS